MRKAIGRGISQLIAEQFEESSNDAAIEVIAPNQWQPRVSFDETGIQELADSIRQHGILQPLAVRPLAGGRYELIAGERRLRAAKLAGLTRVPITVREVGDQDSLELALIENIQREDINALECARAYRRLIDEFGLTQEQVAGKVGKSRVAVANTVRLLKLPARIQEGLQRGAITEGHARALLGLENDAQQLAMYDQILQGGLTVKDVERASQKRAGGPTTRKSQTPSNRDPDWERLEDALSAYFGSPVHLKKEGPIGTVGIDFYSGEDLERILEVLGVTL